MVRRGFVYTFAMDIYAFHLAISGKSHCFWRRFALRFGAKRKAFSTKTHCI